GVDVGYIQRLRSGDADSAALADGVTMNTRMLAHHGAASINYLTFARQTIGCSFSFKVAIDETGIIAVRNQTDFLRLRFLGHRERVFSRHLAHFWLRHLPQRKH